MMRTMKHSKKLQRDDMLSASLMVFKAQMDNALSNLVLFIADPALSRSSD